jgi:hypothetical protein
MNQSSAIRALVLALGLQACSDSAATAPALDRVTPPANDPDPVNPATTTPRTIRLALTGQALLTEGWLYTPHDTVHSWTTSILLANGPIERGRILGDTTLQMNLPGSPQLGARQVTPPRVVITDDFYHYGSDDVLLIVTHKNGNQTFLVQSTPTTITYTSYVAPSPAADGRLVGSITFEAEEYARERVTDMPGFAGFRISKVPGTTVVTATFDTPMKYQLREYRVP